jgi:hypothetical protein
MTNIGPRGQVGAQEYQQWPVFYTVRDDTRFQEAFKAIFGLEYVPSATHQAGLPQVMKWIKQHLDKEETTVVEGPRSLH